MPADAEASRSRRAEACRFATSGSAPTVWVPLLAKLEVPHVGMQALRRSAAARMIGAGWSPKAVQQTLGQCVAGFTKTVHAHLFDDDMDSLADALDRPSRGFLADSGPI